MILYINYMKNQDTWHIIIVKLYTVNNKTFLKL